MRTLSSNWESWLVEMSCGVKGTATGLEGSFLKSSDRGRLSDALGGVELLEGEDGLRIESGRDWEFLLEMVEP